MSTPMQTKTAVPFELAGKCIFVAGHRGMAGSAIVRRLQEEPCELLTAPRGELDLTRQDKVESYLSGQKPDVVIIAAGRVGGIVANESFPVNFLTENLAIALNCIEASHKAGVQKLLYLSSNCIYPRLAAQPVSENQLLTGALEPTNQWYAIAKIAGIKLCEAYRRQHGDDFIAVAPTNLYGPGDNYHPEHGHVVAALIRRFHEAKVAGAPEVMVWGTGTPRREFLYVDDFADACVFALKNYSAAQFLNVGFGEDIAIAEFARTVAEVIGYRGKIVFDPSKPDGMPRKFVDASRLSAMGWKPRVSLRDGLGQAYADFLSRMANKV